MFAPSRFRLSPAPFPWKRVIRRLLSKRLKYLVWLFPSCRTLVARTPRQNVYACARLSISGLPFSHTFQSDQSLPRALGFILCAACGSVVLLHAARVFYYFVVIEIAFMDNQAQITETISRLDSEKVR